VLITDWPTIDVEGQPLRAESRRMLEYLQERAESVTRQAIAGRLHAAALDLETLLATVDERDARQRPFSGKWHMADVVDHISQTQIRGAEELRHLLSGRRPPGPPVYEALKSGASEWTPWQVLLDGLKEANREMVSVIVEHSDATEPNTTADRATHTASVTVRTILVASCAVPVDRVVSQIFIAELDWRKYALLQRLHLLDHRTQIRRLLNACRHMDTAGGSTL
jgi:hypothetical protein